MKLIAESAASADAFLVQWFEPLIELQTENSKWAQVLLVFSKAKFQIGEVEKANTLFDQAETILKSEVVNDPIALNRLEAFRKELRK